MSGPVPQFPAQRADREAPRPIRWLALTLILVSLLPLVKRAATQIEHIQPDFEYFYKAGQALLERGTFDAGYDVRPDGQREYRGTLDWYWPVVHRIMALFALLPFRNAGGLWLLLNIAATIATLRLIGRTLSGLPPNDWPVTQLVPFLLLLLFWTWEFRLNQINIFTLLFMVSSFSLWERGRAGTAGFWLGLAALLKVTPGLLIGWFLLKRQYRTVLVALTTMLLAGPVSDLFVFGPAGTMEAYSSWLERAVTSGSHRGLILQQREMDWRNQGLGAVASRWLHRTNWNTHFDNEPRAPSETEQRFLNVVDLPTTRVAQLVTAVHAGSLLLLALLCRRPARRLSSWALRFEFVLFMLAMLWFMPVMRRYHLIWLLPAVSLLGPLVHYLGFRHRLGQLALGAIAVLVVVQLLSVQPIFEAGGALLLVVPALAIPLVAARVGVVRDENLLTRGAPGEPADADPDVPTAHGRTRDRSGPGTAAHV